MSILLPQKNIIVVTDSSNDDIIYRTTCLENILTNHKLTYVTDDASKFDKKTNDLVDELVSAYKIKKIKAKMFPLLIIDNEYFEYDTIYQKDRLNEIDRMVRTF